MHLPTMPPHHDYHQLLLCHRFLTCRSETQKHRRCCRQKLIANLQCYCKLIGQEHIANLQCHCTMQICNAVGQEHIANLQCHCKSVRNLQCKVVSARSQSAIGVSRTENGHQTYFFMIRYVNDFIKARASRIRRAEAHCKFAMPLQIHRAWAHCNFAMPLHNANVQSSLAGALCKFAMPLHISYNFAMLVCECQTCHTCTGVSRAENCYQTYSLWYVTLKTLSRRELQEFVGQKFFANLQSDFKLIGQKHIAHLQCHCKSITHLQCKFVMVRCARSALVSAGQKIVIKRMFYDTLR